LQLCFYEFLDLGLDFLVPEFDYLAPAYIYNDVGKYIGSYGGVGAPGLFFKLITFYNGKPDDNAIILTLTDNITNHYWLELEASDILSIQNFLNFKPLFPNPAGEFVVLEDADFGIYYIVDNTGKVIMTFEVNQTPYQLDVSGMLKGNYFIIEQKNKSIYKLIIGGN
jgi:hypothetical protein